MNDIDIITKIKNGDKELYSILMNKYHNELFKYVYNLTGNYETTEDLLQEIFLKAYQSLPKYNNNKASFRTWIYRISSNHTINFLKSKKYRESQLTNEFEEYQQSSTIDIEKEIIEDEQINTIRNAIMKVLKPKHQQIMILHYFAHLQVKEISSIIDVPEKTIYNALKSSVEKIKKEVT